MDLVQYRKIENYLYVMSKLELCMTCFLYSGRAGFDVIR